MSDISDEEYDSEEEEDELMQLGTYEGDRNEETGKNYQIFVEFLGTKHS